MKSKKIIVAALVFRRMADNVTVRYSQLQSDSFLNGAMKYFFDIHYSFTDQDPTNFFIG